jgi:YD repeat-containing protein
MAYDLDDRLVSRTYPGGGTLSFGYDQAGLLTTRTNARGIVASCAYDAVNNLTNILYSDETPPISMSYDACHRLTQLISGAGTQSFTYDADGRVTSNVGPWPAAGVVSAFDANGRATNVTILP